MAYAHYTRHNGSTSIQRNKLTWRKEYGTLVLWVCLHDAWLRNPVKQIRCWPPFWFERMYLLLKRPNPMFIKCEYLTTTGEQRIVIDGIILRRKCDEFCFSICVSHHYVFVLLTMYKHFLSTAKNMNLCRSSDIVIIFQNREEQKSRPSSRRGRKKNRSNTHSVNAIDERATTATWIRSTYTYPKCTAYVDLIESTSDSKRSFFMANLFNNNFSPLYSLLFGCWMEI